MQTFTCIFSACCWFCCLGWFHILGHNPLLPPPVHVHIILIPFCYYCLTNSIILSPLCHPFTYQAFSSVCPSDLLGLAESQLSVTLLTAQPFDFLKRLCSHTETLSSLSLSTTQRHTQAQAQSTKKKGVFPFVLHDSGNINECGGFLCFMQRARTLDSVKVQQSMMVTAKI